MSGELVHSEQVLEGEVVDERAALVRRLESTWRGSRAVPPALRSRQALRDAVKGVSAWAVRVPFRCARAVGRGLVISARGWRNWVRVRDYREAAEQSEKLADKFVEIRALTLFRWKVTATVLLVSGVVLAIARLVYGDLVLWILGGVGAVVLAVAGRAKDGASGRKTVLAGPWILMWTMDAQVLIDVFRNAKLIGKDETLRLVERPSRQGDGWAVTVDLPATRKAADVVKNREELASALAVDEIQLSVERVRGEGGHAGRVAIWVADKDPYASAPVRTPLLEVRRWDAWKPVPFGTDARGRRIDLPLVWTSLLIGAIPRQGKTMAERLAVAGLVLDPHARLYVADFKNGKDWRAAEQVAHRFMAGDDGEHVLMFMDWLEELVDDVQQRYRRMQHLDDVTCPESKVTPAMSRDQSLDMPLTALIVDEVHIALEDRTSVLVQGKRLTAGERIGELLTWLAKKAPAAGLVMVLATQRPDSTTIPSKLRAVLGSRFALRVMDWRDSNIVLGDQMNTRGYDSSRLLPSHKGVGILRPDGETQLGADVLALTVRTFYMPNDDWRVICERGRALREAEGKLTGHAAGQDALPVRDREAVVITSGKSDHNGDRLPEPLASVAHYLGEDLSEREFIPTAELVKALDVEPTTFGKEMGDLGCPPARQYVHDGENTRRVRGYLTADIRAAIAESV
ncbi:FtsK/SpoIIIE domain-containing protein [Lentzea sp. NPDC034063]|uniref:FtsK/SpoIIIE domain-containing protein n=1 Tax=unclassified Lentzea TaxID=2643253 RepID=UPI0034018695